MSKGVATISPNIHAILTLARSLGPRDQKILIQELKSELPLFKETRVPRLNYKLKVRQAALDIIAAHNKQFGSHNHNSERNESLAETSNLNKGG